MLKTKTDLENFLFETLGYIPVKVWKSDKFSDWVEIILTEKQCKLVDEKCPNYTTIQTGGTLEGIWYYVKVFAVTSPY